MRKFASLLLFLFAVAGIAHGYTRITSTSGRSPKWPSMPISYSVNERGAPQIPNGSEFHAISESFATWQAVTSADIRFNYRGTTSARGVDRDGINLISFVDDGTPLGSSTLAATFSFYSTQGSELVTSEADIIFNPAHSWSTSGESGKFDIQSVLTHEVGHLLGLDHSGLVSSVMVPFAAPSQVHQRTLLYDDIAGVSEMYPGGTGASGLIRGVVTSSGTPVFGAHVVAVDRDGTSLVSTVSQRDGAYVLRFLPPGEYRVYAEPLDLPVTEDNIGGWYNDLNVGFGTTWSGAVTVPAVGFGASANIEVDPPSPSGMNLKSPSFAVRLARGVSSALLFGGDDISDGVLFTSPTPEVTLGTPTFGGRVSSQSPTSASMSVRVSSTAPLGPKSITARRGTDTVIASGAVVVVNPQPSGIGVSPSTGPAEGQTRVTITGANFRPGVRVYFGGLPSPSVTLINANTLDVTAPANTPGAMNVQVINTDGTNGLAALAYRYVVPPPAITSVNPVSGPPGTSVIIEGEHFFSRASSLEVQFNGVSARVVSSTATRIHTIVPFGATSGPITVTVFGQTTTGPQFTVTVPPVSTNRPPATYRFIDASAAAGGTSLNFSSNDDAVASTVLPFSFTLFRQTYLAGERIGVDVNGWMSLEPDALTEFQNAPLPARTVTRSSGGTGTIAPSLIAPFFDDLIFQGVGSISTRTVGSAPNRQFVVQWSRMSILDEQGRDLNANLTFQAVLFEGSNDIQFVYAAMAGPRADGSSATIGAQDFSRTRAIQSGYNQPVVRDTFFITYRFGDGQYASTLSDVTPPSRPVVTDGGTATNSTSELAASWIAEDPESGIAEYQYAIGRTPGATDVRPFTSTTGNSIVAGGLSLQAGVTYYISVRAVNHAGLISEVGVSDGIRVDPALQTYLKVIPISPQGAGRFTGIALLAHSATSVVLRAIGSTGELISGSGVRNPATITLAAGQQQARVINDIFGLTSFDGWIEIESPAADLGVYAATGSADVTELDGVVPREPSSDFLALHPGATLVMVNPSSRAATATIRDLVAGTTRTLGVPARSRATTSIAGISRVTSTEPLAAVEQFGVQGRLGLTWAEPSANATSSIVLPHGAAGLGYVTAVTMVNPTTFPFDVTVRFASRATTVRIAANSAQSLSLADLFQLSPDVLVVDAVRISAGAIPFGTGRLVAVADIHNERSLASVTSRTASTEVVFPHVAHENGYLTGLCIASGDRGATTTIDVFAASAGTPKSATITLGANQQRVGWLQDLVPSVSGQTGGSIRIRSDQPIWACEIFGTDAIMASVPPL